MSAEGTGEYFPFLQAYGKIVEMEIGNRAIYRPFEEFRRANSFCHLILFFHLQYFNTDWVIGILVQSFSIPDWRLEPYRGYELRTEDKEEHGKMFGSDSLDGSQRELEL
ncbi:hypothetical protein TNCV_2884061 [Trichonephila clavipes]|nr:hypothetical protein TNCV_2884061 [Trichonephila clavipes]